MSADATTATDRETAVPPTVAQLARLTAFLDRCVCRVCVLLFVAIFVTMVLQISFRYVLGAPLVWTEELARYLYIWACYLGAPIALRRGNHITITLAVDHLPLRVARPVAITTHVLAFFFLLQLAIQGAILAVRSHTLIAITIPVPWSLIYLAVPISAALMMLESSEAIWTTRTRPGQEVQA